jgi:hypothetical protein
VLDVLRPYGAIRLLHAVHPVRGTCARVQIRLVHERVGRYESLVVAVGDGLADVLRVEHLIGAEDIPVLEELEARSVMARAW